MIYGKESRTIRMSGFPSRRITAPITDSTNTEDECIVHGSVKHKEYKDKKKQQKLYSIEQEKNKQIELDNKDPIKVLSKILGNACDELQVQLDQLEYETFVKNYQRVIYRTFTSNKCKVTYVPGMVNIEELKHSLVKIETTDYYVTTSAIDRRMSDEAEEMYVFTFNWEVIDNLGEKVNYITCDDTFFEGRKADICLIDNYETGFDYKDGRSVYNYRFPLYKISI